MVTVLKSDMKSNPKKRLNTEDSENNISSNNLREQEKPANESTGDQDFPGYPHYPPKEDIMHPANKMEKLSPDPERLTKSGAYIDPKSIDKPVSSSLDTAADIDEDLVIVPGTEADVTKEDLLILGEQNLEMDEEDTLDNKVLSGELSADLDIPGGELDDSNEELGEEDEENNYYSLGGDRQENLEENPGY
jgi:hypothetical protein